MVLFRGGLVFCLIVLSVEIFVQPGHAIQESNFIINGELTDSLDEPVKGAHITAFLPGSEEPLAKTESRSDGTWTLYLDTSPAESLQVQVERSHYISQSITLNQTDLAELADTGLYRIEALELERKIDVSFWIATGVFLAVLLLIAFEFLHSATAALAGLSVILLVSYIGGAYNPGLTIYTFEQAIGYIDWEVIFLLIGMMIIIAIIEDRYLPVDGVPGLPLESWKKLAAGTDPDGDYRVCLRVTG